MRKLAKSILMLAAAAFAPPDLHAAGVSRLAGVPGAPAGAASAAGPAAAVADTVVPLLLRPPVPPLDAPAQASSAPAADSSASPPETLRTVPLVDYLWVLRSSLRDAGEIDRLVTRAREMKVRGLLVQVVGRGDAYYRSEILPRAESLGAHQAAADTGLFDPLATVLARAHPAGIEVHAWMNCCLVWSSPARPRDPRHVLVAHPEWVARLPDGRPLSRLTAAERRRLKIEGVFLSPAHPGVRTWIARIAQEIARRYPVDGIHLDYIRQPAVSVGYDQTTRARFALASGVDPARRDRLPAPERAAVDSAWAEFQREQVTAIVREVRDSLAVVRPGVSLSAAVFSDTLTAEARVAQPWRSWLRDGLLDRAFVMCYAPIVQTVLDQIAGLAGQLGISDRLVPGIAVYNTAVSTAATKIRAARALGFPVIALYSYDALFERPHGWSTLEDFLKDRDETEQP